MALVMTLGGQLLQELPCGEGEDACCFPMTGVPDCSSGMLIFHFLLCLEEERKMYRGLSVILLGPFFLFNPIAATRGRLETRALGGGHLGSQWQGDSHRGGLREK